eukprot:SAG22_NODE_21552_length_256_cov_0.656051_1_plen_45_part_10
MRLSVDDAEIDVHIACVRSAEPTSVLLRSPATDAALTAASLLALA